MRLLKKLVHRFTAICLSSATHIHGYGLPPTTQELRRWAETVDRFVGLAASG